MDDLAQDGFVEIPRPRNPIGVYALVLKGVVVYVGQSKSVYNRIAQHRVAAVRGGNRGSDRTMFCVGDPMGKRIEFDEVWVRWCPIKDLGRLEWVYIDRFKPRWNIQIREPLPDVNIDIRRLAERMGWKLGEARQHDLLRGRTL